MRSATVVLCLAATAVISSCDSTSQVTGQNCPDIARAAITVEVRDAASAPIARGATVSVSDKKGLIESPQVGYDTLRVWAAYGSRAGRVDVEVTKPGYAPSVVRNILLESTGICNTLKPVTLQIALNKN